MNNGKKSVWSDKVHLRLSAIAEAIEQCAAREGELVRARKAFEDEMRHLGGCSLRGVEKKLIEAGLDKKVVAALMLRSEYTLTLFTLRWTRARANELRDRLTGTIKDADQGKLWEDDDEPLLPEPSEADLFSQPKDEEEDDPDQQTLPVGARNPAGNTPERAKADGYVGDVMQSDIANLELDDAKTKALKAAGFKTIGHLARYLDGGGDLEEKNGIGGATAAAAVSTLKRWRKRQAKAEVEADKAGTAEPLGASA